MHRRLKKVLVAAMTVGFLALPSQVGTASADGTAAAPARNDVCVSEAVPAGSTQRPSAPVCFGSFPEAISYATNGAVQLPEGATRVTQAQLDQGAAKADVGVLANVVIGISYDSSDCCYGTRTWVHEAPYGCDGDTGWEWQINYVGNSWNDDIDWANGGYSGCENTYWEHSDFGGASVGTNWSYGPMEDETSSITFH